MHWNRRAQAAAGMAMFGVLVGCAAEAPAAGRFSVTDSAGIEIATSTAPQWEVDAGWRIADTPSLGIGVVEGDERLQFQRVRAVAIAPEGRVVVANGGSSQLRVFDTRGQWLASMGGRGGGPGEFQYFGLVHVSGDTLVVHDPIAQRFTRYHRDGTLLGTVPLVGNADTPPQWPVARFADGSWLMKAEVRSGAAPQEGLRRQQEALHHVSAEGTALGTVGVFPGQELNTTRTPDGRLITGGSMYGRSLSHAVHDTFVFVGTQDDASIRVLGRDGTLRRIIRLPVADLTLTERDAADVRTYLESRPVAATDPAYVSRMLAMWPMPERKPAYAEFRADPDGNLWVGAPTNTMFSDGPSTWNVIDHSGRFLGSVRVPARFRVLDIGRDAMAGVWRDDDGVEYIHVYPIIKN